MNHSPLSVLEYEILGEEKRIYTSPSFKALVEIKLKDKYGKEKLKRKQPFKSFVSNFAYILNYAFLNQSLTNKIKDTSNANATASTHTMDVTEAALTNATSEYGIWIGNVTNNPGTGLTGDLTQDSNMGSDIGFSDYGLNTKIPADGDPLEVEDTDVVYYATTISFESDGTLVINRSFANNRVNSINISEVGLIGRTNNTEDVLLARDTINDGTQSYLEVPSSYVVDISYKFKVTSTNGFVNNFLSYLSSEFNGGDTVNSIKNSIGASQTVDFTTGRTSKDMLGGATNTEFGLLVGGYPSNGVQGTMSLDKTRHNLQAKLDATYLTYGATTALNTSDLTFTSSASMFGVQRDFTNVSETIGVNIYEAGLFIKHTSSTQYYMLSRLLTQGSGVPYITLQPNKILRLKYYLVFPVGSILKPIAEET